MTKSIPELDTLLVHVTQDDIDRGVKNDCRSCAVGLALQRILPKTFGSVGLYTASIQQNRGWISYFARLTLPAITTHFIRSFDSIHQRNVKPFSFEISLT